MALFDRYKRSNDALCKAVEDTLAQAGRGAEVLPGDFSAFIEQQPDGKYGLVFWTMDLASAEHVKTDGDVTFEREQEAYAKIAETKFDTYLRETNGEPVSPESGPFSGHDDVHVFDSKEALLVTVNAFRVHLKADAGIRCGAILASVLQPEARSM